MLTDLALIDWIALVFAAVLLAAAAAAGLVAYATAKNRPTNAGHRPAHAAESASPPPPKGKPVPESVMRSSAPIETLVHRGGGGAHALHAADAVDVDGLDGAGDVMIADRTSDSQVDVADQLVLEPAVETVAARAAKLRGRPVPDTDSAHKRIVSAVEPKRMPAHAPNRAFSAAGQIAIDTSIAGQNSGHENGQGFAARTPGFFEDPVGRHELRYWDGHRWTEYVKEHGERFTDPL